jgi:hypothetical protein
MTGLHAVLVPLSTRLARAERFLVAREATAEALRASAELARAPRSLPCERWPREASGAPAVVRGWHASFADTTGLVVALVARAPLALDCEWLRRPRWEAARAHLVETGESREVGSQERDEVLAAWVAKESVLKLAGVGLAELSHCRIVARTPEGFRLAHRGEERVAHVAVLGAHLVAWCGDRADSLRFTALEHAS